MRRVIFELALSKVAHPKIVCSCRRIKKISGNRKTQQLSYYNRRIILIAQTELIYIRKLIRCCLELIMMALL